MVKIAPSMLSANFSRLEEDCLWLNHSDADWFHLDIMDGIFVPNISYGFPVVEAISRVAKKPMDAHLMIVEPQRYLENFAKAGVQWLSVHYEACPHLHRTLQQIRQLGMKAGVAINPHSSVHLLEDVLDSVDYILVMSVNPGFGGQSFIPRSLDKVKALNEMRLQAGSNFLIEVDGGVNLSNAGSLVAAGADILVAGSALFKSPDKNAFISEIKSLF